MNRKAPAFQLYADDFLAGTFDMTNDEVGAYIRLMCLQWSKGGVDSRAVNSVKRMGSPKAVDAVVDDKFDLQDDGLLRNRRLESVREKSQEFIEKKSKAGKAGASKRWQTDGKRMAVAWQTHGKRMADDMANECPPSPPPSPTNKTTAATKPSASETAAAADWNLVFKELSERGVGTARQSANESCKSGCSADDILEIIAFWDGSSGSYDAGALAYRVRNAFPGQKACEGWPKPHKPPQEKSKVPNFESFRANRIRSLGIKDVDADAERAIESEYSEKFGVAVK